jgi:hypothetical protein
MRKVRNGGVVWVFGVWVLVLFAFDCVLFLSVMMMKIQLQVGLIGLSADKQSYELFNSDSNTTRVCRL